LPGVDTGPNLPKRGVDPATGYEQNTPRRNPDGSPFLPKANTVVVVVLAEFTDWSFPDGYDADYFDEMLFDNTAGRLSMYNFYQEVSYGQFSISGDVYGPVTLPHTLAYYAEDVAGVDTDAYGNGSWRILQDAFYAADSIISYGIYDLPDSGQIHGNGTVDHFVVITAAYNQAAGCPPDSSVWPVRWGFGSIGPSDDGHYINGGAINTFDCQVGVIAHEFGHDIGYPDLYDYDDGDPFVRDYNAYPFGDWCLMAHGAWGCDASGVPGSGPSHVCGFLKWRYSKWIKDSEITVVTADQEGMPLPAIQTSKSLLKIPVDFSNPESREYFLVENRNCSDTSGFMFDHYSNYGIVINKDSGLIITHVDELAGAWGSNNGTPGASHYWTWVEDPGEPDDLELWPGELKVDAAFSAEDNQKALTPYTLPYDSRGYDDATGLFIATESNSGNIMYVDVRRNRAYAYPSILVLNHTGGDRIEDPDIPLTYARQDSIWVRQASKGGYYNLNLRSTLPASLNDYDVIAYLLSWENGMNPGGLSASEKNAIAGFLDSGGSVYAEGPDVADMLDGSDLFDYFGCSFDGETEGVNGVSDLVGYGGSLASGMSFDFARYRWISGMNAYVDELSTTSGFGVLYDQRGIDRAIANDGGPGRTIISSVMLAGMSDDDSPSTKADLSASYISFLLGITPAVVTGFSAEEIEEGVLLSWMAAEAPDQGFNIYRRDARGRSLDYRRLNDFPVFELSFLDSDIEPKGEYFYRLGAVDLEGHEVFFGPITVIIGDLRESADLLLSPNPFNPYVEIRLPAHASDGSTIEIYDIRGSRVTAIGSSEFQNGSYVWDGSSDKGQQLPSGVYFIRLHTARGVLAAKAVLLK
jgi:immune inhibitor A